MIFNNIIYYGEDFRFHYGSVKIEDGIVAGITEEGRVGESDTDSHAGRLNYLIPGLIDIHTHGNSAADFSDGDPDGLKRMAQYLACNGITSFSPASMTLSEQALEQAFRNAAEYRKQLPEGHSKLMGITMEGPFFSEKYKGAQPAAHLRLPDVEAFERLNAAAEGLIKIVCVAPELDGAERFIRAVSKKAVVSIAHTSADYETAFHAIEIGVSHLTHLFNAMPPLLHRAPGVIGAAADNPKVTAELICDGIHVHPSMIRAAFRLFGCERIVLVSDSVRACGMEDGIYTLGGQEIKKSGSRAALKDGTIAGSVTNLFECMKNAIDFGIPREDAIRAATYNPAAVLGIQQETGSIGIGKRADLVLCSNDFTILETYIDGKKAEV